MTRDDLHTEVRRLVRRVPMVPIAVDLTDGHRVFIDKRGQARPWNDGIAVRQSVGPTVMISASRVARVTPLDQLAADGHVRYDDFYAAIRGFLAAEPFHPFVVELDDGTAIPVERPTVGLAGRFCTVHRPAAAGGPVQFRVDRVARLTAGVPTGVA